MIKQDMMVYFMQIKKKNIENFKRVKVGYNPESNVNGTTTYYPHSWQYLSTRDGLMFNEDQIKIIEWIYTYWYKYGDESILEAIVFLINSGLYKPLKNPTCNEIPSELEGIWDKLDLYSKMDIIHEVTTLI